MCVRMCGDAGELWGELTPNGSWSGMVGLFARGEGDIGVANLFITALGGRRKFQEYTAPYGQEVGPAALFLQKDTQGYEEAGRGQPVFSRWLLMVH